VNALGNTTVTLPPGVEGVPNPQAGNDTSDCPTRTSRAARPPGSGKSNRSWNEALLPEKIRWPKLRRRFVKSAVRLLTPTDGEPVGDVSRKLVVPGWTWRRA
jgi:hypothetical protein